MDHESETRTVVQEAEAFYKEIAEREKLIDVSASEDVAPGVKLRHLIDPQGWLPFIMLRSDEVCQLLTGQKMWNAAYVSDPMALRGLSVVDLQTLDEEKLVGLDLPGSFADSVPKGAKSIIALEGLRSSIDFKNNQCFLKNLPKAYFVHGMIEEGECLPSVPQELFFAIEMNKQTLKVLPTLSQMMNASHEINEVKR